MEFLKKGFGKFLYKLGRLIDVVLGFIIDLLDTILGVMRSIGRVIIMAVMALFFMTVMFLFIGVVGILLLPTIVKLGFIFVVIPFILDILNRALKILKFGLTEYLYDKSNYLIDGESMRFSSFIEYFKEYIRNEEEKKRRAEEERIRQEEARRKAYYEEQERRQREFFESMFGGGFSGGFNQGSYENYGNFSGVTDLGFREKFEKACDTLGISYNTTKEEVRKAFRQMAKKYHPDINKSEDATEVFQRINEANEFLTEENINRYKNMN